MGTAEPGSCWMGTSSLAKKQFTALWKHFPMATNKPMESRAVMESLKYLPPQIVVQVSTDSKYVKNGVTDWIFRWDRNGSKNATK
jgi:ribonuclease HI